jgi:hypothetical protein
MGRGQFITFTDTLSRQSKPVFYFVERLLNVKVFLIGWCCNTFSLRKKITSLRWRWNLKKMTELEILKRKEELKRQYNRLLDEEKRKTYREIIKLIAQQRKLESQVVQADEQ